METEELKSLSNSTAGRIILMMALIPIVVLVLPIMTHGMDVFQWAINWFNHFLTVHGMCSHGYEQQCHQTPLHHRP